MCDNEADCISAGGKWDNDSCNSEPKQVCQPDWQPGEWQAENGATASTTPCGTTFTETRTYTDVNNCGTDKGKVDKQEISGTSCESRANADGVCQSDGACAYTCQDGFFDCDNDMSNGCESDSACPSN